MESPNDRRSEAVQEAKPPPSEAGPAEAKDGSLIAPAEPAGHPAERPSPSWRKRLLLAIVAVGLAVGGFFLVPAVRMALNTVSTDDAYVNGHVTFVAPRVAGQVTKVTDPNTNVTTYSYDAMNRETGETDAEGSSIAGISTYTYDAAGNQITSTNPDNHTTTTTYDALNRAISTTHPDGTSETMRYDLVGRMTLDEKILQMQDQAPAIQRLAADRRRRCQRQPSRHRALLALRPRPCCHPWPPLDRIRHQLWARVRSGY